MQALNNLKIFLAHRVNPQHDPIWPPISPKLFEEIIVYLKKKYNPVQLENYLLGNEKNTSNKPSCALVFDDGYKDFAEYALPILHKHRFPCSMYVVINCVEKNLPPWTYLLNYLFIKTEYNSLEIDSDSLHEQFKKVRWKHFEEKFRYVIQISPQLKSLPTIEAEKIISQIFSQLNDVELPRNLMLNWDELKAIKSDFCHIGSHSLSHPLLSKSLYTQEIETELLNSYNTIKEKLGHDPLTISYPFGASDYRVIKTAQKCGYKFGLNVNKIPNISTEYDYFNIPRIELFSESFFKSKLRINGYINHLKNLSKLKTSDS